MAPIPTAVATSALRAVTTRLTSTPVEDLPPIASYLAAGLLDCGEILSSSQNQLPGGDKIDAGVLVHKLRARISSLLQGRSVAGRWAAIILIKAVIELGGWEILRTSEHWVRGLLGILGKQDPTTSKKLSILTLTRIFFLTHQYPTLVREVTTPLLPSFITLCLNLVSTANPTGGGRRSMKSRTPLLETVLDAFHFLLPSHPTIFRPFVSQFHSLLLTLVAPTPSSAVSASSSAITVISRQLFVSLHHCAPKNTSGDEWGCILRTTIASIHHTLDQVFRAVVEESESAAGSLGIKFLGPKDFSATVSDGGNDPLGMPAWSGIHDGSQRLIGSLRLLSDLVTERTSSTVSLPLGSIVEVINRVNLVTARDTNRDQIALKVNPEIHRDEREALYAALPSIHAISLTVLLAILERLQRGALPVAQAILEQVLWVFEAESWDQDIRTATYTVLEKLLPLVGPLMPRRSVKSLSAIIKVCCNDMVALHGVSPDSNTPILGNANTSNQNTQTNGPSSTTADSLLAIPATIPLPTPIAPTHFPGLLIASSNLLPIILTYLPSEHLPPAIRADIDRTGIVLSLKQIILASVLNPGPTIAGHKAANSSIMPFLARQFPGDLEVEGLLRPRMPILFTGGDGRRTGEFSNEEDEDSGMWGCDLEEARVGEQLRQGREGFEKPNKEHEKDKRAVLGEGLGDFGREEATKTPKDELLGPLSAALRRAEASPAPLLLRGYLKRPSSLTEGHLTATPHQSVDSDAVSKRPRLDTSLGEEVQPALGPSAVQTVNEVEDINPPLILPVYPRAYPREDAPVTGPNSRSVNLTAKSHHDDGKDNSSDDHEIPALNIESDTSNSDVERLE